MFDDVFASLVETEDKGSYRKPSIIARPSNTDDFGPDLSDIDFRPRRKPRPSRKKRLEALLKAA